MTRIVRIHGAGGPEVLKLDDIEVPAAGRGEIGIRVAAAGLNRVEIYRRKGLYGPDRGGQPSPIGSEAAGVVEDVGPDVEGFSPGDAVTILPGIAALPFGTYADRIIAPAHAVIAQPAGLSAVEAAALWTAYLTAYAPLVEIAKVGVGDVVLLTAASSSVGTAAISIVRRLGGIPVALTRTRAKADRLKAVGAAQVIVTDEENIGDRVREITAGAGARVAFDAVAGPGLAQLVEGLATDDGLVVHYGGLSGAPTLLPSSMLVRNLTIAGYAMDIGRNDGRRERAVRFISDGVASGAFRPVVDRTFPLEAAAAAHAALEDNRHVGKIVLTAGAY